jgi:hypothetical protein
MVWQFFDGREIYTTEAIEVLPQRAEFARLGFGRCCGQPKNFSVSIAMRDSALAPVVVLPGFVR